MLGGVYIPKYVWECFTTKCKKFIGIIILKILGKADQEFLYCSAFNKRSYHDDTLLKGIFGETLVHAK